MQVIKRNGQRAEFDKTKIIIAIEKAMYANGFIDSEVSKKIAEEIEAVSQNKILWIADIESLVYSKLIDYGYQIVARSYEGYRAVREYQRKTGIIDNKVLSVIDGTDENIKDNSNKDIALISTMRDLVAEEVSKDISLRMKLPAHIAQAHRDGIIYVHDLGHYLNPSTNCELVNLEDMLQNGTVINRKLIEKPKSLRTACTIASQICALVASSQFGGQTITLTHLAPFVRDSFNRYLELYKERGIDDELAKGFAEEDLRREIKDGIQTFNYQLNTLQTSNGQSPFVSVGMYIEDGSEYEKETAMLIEEMLKQRIQGMKNEVGTWIAPAFPKLLYVLDENNTYKGSKYYYLTELAAECVVKRMMPDFLSAKKLRENYGDIVFPMGKRSL